MRLPPFIASLLALVLPALAADTLEFTNIHTRSANWLVAALHPLTGCQEIAIDSVKVADKPTTYPNGGIWVSFGPPYRQVSVWWHTDSLDGGNLCSNNSKGARRLVPLPNPRKSPGNDTLLDSWIVDRVVSYGPAGKIGIFPVKVVDQAGDQGGPVCPVYDCWFVIDTVAPPIQEVRDSLKSWISVDGSLVLASSGGAPILEQGSIQDSVLVDGLGSVTPWNLGNQAWKELQPIRVLQSWGETAPRNFLKATGRRVYKWAGTGGTTCCTRCDTICDFFPPNGGMVYTGGDLIVSNDSTFECLPRIDASMETDLQGHWLLRPTRGEVDSGVLSRTFSVPGVCAGGRIRAFQVVRDSLVYRAGKYALADLLPMSGIRSAPSGSETSIRAAAGGWRITGAEGLQVRLRDLHGRILFQGAGANLFVPAPRHGSFLLQAGATTVSVVR